MTGHVLLHPSAIQKRSRFTAAVASLVLAFACLTSTAARSNPGEPAQPKYGWREVWGGGDAMRDVWLLYTGMTLAPWSEHVYDPGFRLRSHMGYGEFNYVPSNTNGRSVRGTAGYADALIGYHWRAGELTAKAFAGIAAIDRRAPKASTDRTNFGMEYGPKLMLELWYNLGDAQWTSLNMAFTTAHKTASARWRWGYKVLPELSVGPELRFDTNDFRAEGRSSFFDQYSARCGAFISYKWPDMELSVAGGIASRFQGAKRDDDDTSMTPYATVNLLFQY
jgi:Cellulose biosynthesis protein BcsS